MIYWTNGTIKYSNKYDALQGVRGKSSMLLFSFHEKVFDDCDFTVEPILSYDELLKQRAQQLRDTHSYIRLWYSGESDSNTILKAFLNNNIHIDEIVTVRDSVSDNFDGFYGAYEANLISLPQFKKFAVQLRNTKLTVKELGNDYFNFLYDENHKDRVLASNLPASMIRRGRNLFTVFYDYFGKEFFKDNYTEIVGYQKPRLRIKDGEFIDETMADAAFNDTTYDNQEAFFTTPNMPELHIKQCHMVKSYIKSKYPNLLNGLINEKTQYKDDIATACRLPFYNPVKGIAKDQVKLVSIPMLRDLQENDMHLFDNCSEFYNDIGHVWKAVKGKPRSLGS